MQRWKKLGHIFSPEKNHEWMQIYAQNTVAELIQKSTFRIYFSTRNTFNQSSIGFVEIDLEQPQKILKISDQPILTPGERGLFDDSGVSLSCIKTIGGKKHLYYLGWNLRVTVPWQNSIGLAIQNSQGVFEKYSQAPLLDRSAVDPFSISYPFVLEDDGRYRMYYGSNKTWGNGKQEDMAHVIKYAESEDGIHWNRTGKTILDFIYKNEYAISRPQVVHENGIYKMWYSHRGSPKSEKYRIGYAESTNALDWTRKDDEAGIDVSPEGWDSEMICYPHIFDHAGRRYMLYNGNHYGKVGFGLAVLESA